MWAVIISWPNCAPSVFWLCITLLVYSGGCIALRWAIIQPTRREQSALSDADRGSTASWNRARGHLLHLLVHLILHLPVHLLVHLLVQFVHVHLLIVIFVHQLLHFLLFKPHVRKMKNNSFRCLPPSLPPCPPALLFTCPPPPRNAYLANSSPIY